MTYSAVPMISAQDLRKSYGERIAVDGISFDVPKGETLGLLGPNGAGKTTTIHLLIGLLDADGGTVELDGHGDPRRAEVRGRIGVAPQKLAIYEELTGAENLAFFGGLYGLRGSELRDRVDWALDFVGLTSRRKDRVVTYSGGMQRRINLACALIHDPDVILLDEPTVGVDPQSRHHIFELIERLQSRERTILYTTHYMEEAQRLCHRVAIIDYGKILAIDSVPRLIEQYGGTSLVELEVSEVPAEAADWPGTLEGNTYRLLTERPFEEVARFAATGANVERLQIDRPNLESVFLSLTGRSLRD